MTLDKNTTEQYEIHVQKLETKIETEFFSVSYIIYICPLLRYLSAA